KNYQSNLSKSFYKEEVRYLNRTSLYSFCISVELFFFCKIILGSVSFQWKNPFMNGIDKPVGLGEEVIFQFVGWSDPVARTNNHRWGIEVIKSQFSNIRSHFTHERTPCRCIT